MIDLIVRNAIVNRFSSVLITASSNCTQTSRFFVRFATTVDPFRIEVILSCSARPHVGLRPQVPWSRQNSNDSQTPHCAEPWKTHEEDRWSESEVSHFFTVFLLGVAWIGLSQLQFIDSITIGAFVGQFEIEDGQHQSFFLLQENIFEFTEMEIFSIDVWSRKMGFASCGACLRIVICCVMIELDMPDARWPRLVRADNCSH